MSTKPHIVETDRLALARIGGLCFLYANPDAPGLSDVGDIFRYLVEKFESGANFSCTYLTRISVSPRGIYIAQVSVLIRRNLMTKSSNPGICREPVQYNAQ
jgi:hypothetical protein